MKDQIEVSAKGLANQIRSFVKSKSKYWKQVPYFALYADGKSGYNNQYSWAYNDKIWKINPDDIGIDLNNSNLVYFYQKTRPIVKDNDIISYAGWLHLIDGEIILNSLIKEAQEPQMSYIKVENNNWREEMIKIGNIEIPTIASLI